MAFAYRVAKSKLLASIYATSPSAKTLAVMAGRPSTQQ